MRIDCFAHTGTVSKTKPLNMITTVSVNKSFLDECNGCAESFLEVFNLEVLCFKPQNLQGITFLVAQKDVI